MKKHPLTNPLKKWLKLAEIKLIKQYLADPAPSPEMWTAIKDLPIKSYNVMQACIIASITLESDFRWPQVKVVDGVEVYRAPTHIELARGLRWVAAAPTTWSFSDPNSPTGAGEVDNHAAA